MPKPVSYLADHVVPRRKHVSERFVQESFPRLHAPTQLLDEDDEEPSRTLEPVET